MSHKVRHSLGPFHLHVMALGKLCICRRVLKDKQQHCSLLVPCMLRGCKNRPTPFPGQMYKVTKPGSLFFIELYIWTTFHVLLVFVCMCSVFWLFWLSCQYLPSDWLERLLWGSLTVLRGSSPQSPGRRVFMISWSCWIFIVSLLYISYCYGTI